MERNDLSADGPEVVTEANLQPGLPPPIEALQARFPPEDGFTVAYGTWIDASSSDGPRTVPVAIVEKDDGSTVTFFPMGPGSPHGT